MRRGSAVSFTVNSSPTACAQAIPEGTVNVTRSPCRRLSRRAEPRGRKLACDWAETGRDRMLLHG